MADHTYSAHEPIERQSVQQREIDTKNGINPNKHRRGFSQMEGTEAGKGLLSDAEAARPPGYSKPLFPELALNLQLHKREKCPNIVQMLDWFEKKERCIIVMEFPHPCLTLWDFLELHYVSETLARHFMMQVVIAAQHWLDHGVNHGDLSLKNVLINTETMQVKVIHFGCSHLISTINDLGSGYCDQAYAVADTVNGMGKLLKKIDSCNEMYKVAFREREYVPLSEECKDLIERSMSSNLVDGLSLDEFSDHEWFKQG